MAIPKNISIGVSTDLGFGRDLNEDYYGTPSSQNVSVIKSAKRGALIAVADGMGGHAAGEFASKTAIETLFNTFYNANGNDPEKALASGYAEANKAIFEIATKDTTKSNMGTTLVAAVFKNNSLYVANVGDSRAYLVHDGKIQQITQDHSWVADQVRAGVLTEDQAKHHMYKSVITRAIGKQATVRADTFTKRLRSDDVFILCSDGLTNKVDSSEIQGIVTSASDPRKAVDQLIALANERGGDDNVTAIVVQRLHSGNRMGLALFAAIIIGTLALVILTFVIIELVETFT